MPSTRFFCASLSLSGRRTVVWCLLMVCLLSAGCRGTKRARTRAVCHPHHTASLRTEYREQNQAVPPQTVPETSDVAHSEAPPPPENTPDPNTDDWAAELPIADAAGDTPAADTTAEEPEEWIISTEDEALAWLEQSGASVGFDYDDRTVASIDLAFLRITDDQLQILAFFPQLKELDLTGTDVSDVGLATLSGLRELESLKLRGTILTDAGLEHFAALSKLKILDLSRTTVSDIGLTLLAEMPELRYLLLNHTQVTDEGLILLSRMSTLRGINLIGTQATQDAIAELQEQMPDCVIISATSEDLSAVRPPEDYEPAETPRKDVSQTERALREKFEQLVQLAGEKPELAQHLAAVCASNHRWSEAVEILGSLPAEKVKDVEVCRQLANALVHCDRSEDALHVLREVVGEAVAHQQVGRMIFDRALASSESHLIRSLQLDPQNSETRRQMQLLRQQQSRKMLMVSEQATPVFDEWVPEVQPGNHDGEQIRAATTSRSREPQLPSWKQKQTHPVGWSSFGQAPVWESAVPVAPGFIRN